MQSKFNLARFNGYIFLVTNLRMTSWWWILLFFPQDTCMGAIPWADGQLVMVGGRSNINLAC